MLLCKKKASNSKSIQRGSSSFSLLFMQFQQVYLNVNVTLSPLSHLFLQPAEREHSWYNVFMRTDLILNFSCESNSFTTHFCEIKRTILVQWLSSQTTALSHGRRGFKGMAGNCAGKCLMETAATERFSPALSQNCLTSHYLLPRARQSLSPSSSLLETIQLLLPYTELLEVSETPALQTICISLHLQSREDFQEGEGTF